MGRHPGLGEGPHLSHCSNLIKSQGPPPCPHPGNQDQGQVCVLGRGLHLRIPCAAAPGMGPWLPRAVGRAWRIPMGTRHGDTK